MQYFEDKFTEGAKKLLSLAHENAENLGALCVGSEHLLLAMTKDDGSLSQKYLAAHSVTQSAVLQKIRLLSAYGKSSRTVKDYSAKMKRLLEKSFNEAHAFLSLHIAPEHIFLAIIKDADSTAWRIMLSLGILPSAYDEIADMLSTGRKQNVQKKNQTSKTVPTPTLNKYGRDLTLAAFSKIFDPVIGRDEEINLILQILSRRNKSNPCIVGEPGVGKTAIAEQLATLSASDSAPYALRGKHIVALDLSLMLAGAKYRGEFEERLKSAIDELEKNRHIILFIDEIHTLVGAGAAEGAIDASNILKPVLARGSVRIIGATTPSEYSKYIENDPALERRFRPVKLTEPDKDASLEILRGIRKKYECFHHVRITDDALISSVNLSERYITDRFLPDKAIDLLDEACAAARLKNIAANTMPENVFSAATNDNFITVNTDDIAQTLSDWLKIPVSKLSADESESLLHLEDTLKEKIIGQDDAIKKISYAIRRGRTALKVPHRPIGSFIFSGPTGVGKTELSKELSRAVFGGSDSLIRLDMSEYMEKHSVSKLIGAPPGYVGYDEGGLLTDKIRRRPSCVVLFDEIEKAHSDVFNLLLQILDDGVLTDSRGRKADFQNAIIIMTSNIGAEKISGSLKSIGFSASVTDNEKIEESVTTELKKTFRPEFLNRVDEIIVFHPLEKKHLIAIAENMLCDVKKRMQNADILISFDNRIAEKTAEDTFSLRLGARPLRRAICRDVEDVLAEGILCGKIQKGKSYFLSEENEKIVIQ